MPPPNWLINDWLPTNSLVLIYGEPASGKTFVALGMAGAIATGIEWNLSTGGSMSDHQRDLVRSVVTKADKRGAEIVLATDADDAGQTLAWQIQALAPGVRMFIHVPKGEKDWNDILQRGFAAGEEEGDQSIGTIRRRLYL